MKYSRRNVYRYLKEKVTFSKRLMILYGILTMFITIVSLISPYLYKILVDEVMTEGHINLLYIVIPSMVGVYLLKVILLGMNTYISKKFSYKTALETKHQVMQKFLNRNILLADEINVGEDSNILEKDSEASPTFLLKYVVDFVTSFVLVVVYMTLMVKINVWLGLLSLVLLPLSIWISYIIGRKMNTVNKESHVIGSKMKSHLFDTVQKWREIKTNTLEARFSEQYDEMLEPDRKLGRKSMFYYALNDFFYGLKEEFFMKVLIYFVGGLFIISKEISVGDLLMFISYMASMSALLDGMIQSNTEFRGQEAVFERLFKILEEAEMKKQEDYPQNAEIVFQNIGYTYGNTEKYVLENATCKFECSKKYLLIGRSGEGKSTLVKILLGINRPQKGKVLFNTISGDQIDSRKLLKNVGAVMQDSMFFNLSIRENLELIAPEASEADMTAALKAAALYDFVESLPDKLDTVIGERGVKLSGGQKQRLGIARLILQNPQIIILDEATSALDSIVESKIMDNLSELFRDRTMIVISHKPLANFRQDETYLVENKNIRTYKTLALP